MMMLFCVVLLFQINLFCHGFLPPENKTSASSQGGNSLTDEHYVQLMGLVSEDRQNMAKVEQFILQLQNNINATKQQNNAIVKLQKELNQVKTDNEALKQEVTKLKQENAKSRICINGNQTVDILVNRNLDACNHSRSYNSMNIQQNIQELKNITEKMSTQLNFLTSTSQGHGQDFIGLLQETNTAKQQISVLETETKQQINALEKETKQIYADLQKYKNHTATKIDNILKRKNQTVVLTAHFPDGTMPAKSIVKFSSIITSIGIKDINGFKNSGKFTCEVAGVYLFSVSISSNSYFYAGFWMFKNGTTLALVYINNSLDNNDSFHTGTGIAAVSLNVGDTLYVQSYQEIFTYSDQNVMTIIKVR